MKRFDARKAVMDALKEKGLYRDKKDNAMVVPVCRFIFLYVFHFIKIFSRSKDIIEPILKAQWYVKCDHMAQKALKAVADGELKLVPDFHINTWNRWLENSR